MMTFASTKPLSAMASLIAASLLVVTQLSQQTSAFAPSFSTPHRLSSAQTTTRPRIPAPAFTTSTSISSTKSTTQLHALALTEAVAELNQLPATVQAAYAYCLQAYQLPTQMATFGAFSATGDAIAQNVAIATTTTTASETDDDEDGPVEEQEQYDPERTFRYLLKGLGGGIIWSYWYGVADPLALQFAQALGVAEGSSWEQPARIAAAIFLEQMVAAPLSYAAWDIPVPALLSGQCTARQVPAQIRHKLGPLLWANAKVWTPVNVVTYSLPAEWRLLFVSAMELLWQSVNSQITSQPADALQQQQDAAAKVQLSTSSD